MMHYKRRLIPVNLLDIPAVETWLADHAEKGLFLVSSGNYFAKFETAEPAKVTYRLEVTADPFLRADPDKKNTVFSGIWLGIYLHIRQLFPCLPFGAGKPSRNTYRP